MAEGRKARDFVGDSVASVSSSPCPVSKESDPYTTQLIQQVFCGQGEEADSDGGKASKNLNLHTLQSHIESVLDKKAKSVQPPEETSGTYCCGRIGPPEVIFDILSNVGTLIVEPDRLGISSHSNFSSIRANCCVYKDKWVYELFLGSKGVMQLGWCTINCKFSQEEGVGDTPDSYSYDGSRIRKWNVKAEKYGELWLTGDVISCALDCDEGTITFYRNGVSLGQAFSSVKIGPGWAYFPAVSLSLTESLRANFGATPLRYPIEGYRPLQAPPKVDLVQMQVLFNYMEQLLPVMTQGLQADGGSVISGKAEEGPTTLGEHRSTRCSTFLVASHILDKMAPFLRSAYIVEACLLPFLLRQCQGMTVHSAAPGVEQTLELLWALLQEFELKTLMENLIISLLSSYRFSPVTPDFSHPKKYLLLMLAILRHQRTRRYLLCNILFDKIKFPIFMHIKPPDDKGLVDILPIVWWERGTTSENATVPPMSAEEKTRKMAYETSCDKLRRRIEEIEAIQVEMLKLLLTHTDAQDRKTTRMFFLEKFKAFLRENSGLSRVHQMNTCPLPVSLCFFHRILTALRYYWDDFQKEDPSRFVSSSEAFVPIQEFWQDTRDYVDFQRCGGLMSHLNRTLGGEVNRAQNLTLQEDGKIIKMEKQRGRDPPAGGAAAALGAAASAAGGGEDYPELEMPSGNSLMELLDGLVLLYHVAAHKQLSKMCSLRDNMKDYVTALADTEEKIQRCPPELTDVREDLVNAKAVFVEKVTEQARHMGWVIAVIYSKAKRQDVAWLFRVVLKTIEKATRYRQLFQYMPEFYIEAAVNCYSALSHFFHPTLTFSSLPDHRELLERFAMFLASHFADSRIVSNDLRDTLVQSLACFTCFPETLAILENLPMDTRISMIRSLVAPYESRSWAHTNWILVRLWKGCGFAFRYVCLPNLVPSKVQPTEFSFVSIQKPCPSQIFQSLMAKILLDDEPLATRFLDTLMNQLNWSFSEFVGIMQEIQQVVARTEHLLLESRQLKICSACFEISVCLLRVLEMIVTIAPQIFTDWTRPSAELFLKRMMQLLSQVLSRITIKNGAFENLVSLPIPGLDSVTYFPILTVSVGILVQTISRARGTNQERATRALLMDTGFQLNCLEFLLGSPSSSTGSPRKEKAFCLASFEEVSREEVEEVEELLAYLRVQQEMLSVQSQEVSEEDLCTICYAYPRSAVFLPCEHQSCRTCITQQMMNKKECFFCKSVITAVHDLKGQPILREHSQAQGYGYHKP